MAKLIAWRHPGFSPHVGKRIAPEDKLRLEDTAAYLAKVYQVAPLLCVRCGKRVSIIAFVTDAFAIRRVLDHLGLRTPEAEELPPPFREVLRVAEQGEGWGVPAQWE